MELLQRISNLFVERLVANSETVKEFVIKTEKMNPARVDVLYNGLDINAFRQDPASRDRVRIQHGAIKTAVLVGCVASLRPVKGTEYFVEAAAIVLRSKPDVFFMLVGDGPLESQLRQRVFQLGIADRFIFAGAQP